MHPSITGTLFCEFTEALQKEEFKLTSSFLHPTNLYLASVLDGSTIYN